VNEAAQNVTGCRRLMDVAVRAHRSPTMHYFTSPDKLIKKKITDTGQMSNYVKRFTNVYTVRKLPFGVEDRLSESRTWLLWIKPLYSDLEFSTTSSKAGDVKRGCWQRQSGVLLQEVVAAGHPPRAPINCFRHMSRGRIVARSGISPGRPVILTSLCPFIFLGILQSPSVRE